MGVTNWNSIEKNMKEFVPDILINNSGYVVTCSIREANLENAKKHFDVNLSGTFYCSQWELKYNPNLEIINIGSVASIETHATLSECCTTKAAVVMATKCWA